LVDGGVMLGRGDMVAGYRIESLIGAGGMATVYRAEQVSLGRPVALKLLSPQLGRDEAFRERFRREGKHAAALHHANVVTIFDSGESNGQLFMAMQLIEGSTLAELLATETLSADETVALLGPIGEALDAAHALGLVHRDVKPQNILLGQGDHPYLADFGIAKTSTSSSALTATGGFVGSLNYAAPEQICGEPVTAAVDVYAFTAVLYQCLTGQVPYVRETDASVMYAHLNDPPPSLPEESPQAQELNQIIACGMAKDPADRYADASHVIAETATLLDRLDAGTRNATPLFPLDAATRTRLAETRKRDQPTPSPSTRSARTAPLRPRAPSPSGRDRASTVTTAPRTRALPRRSALLAAIVTVAAVVALAVVLATSRSPSSHAAAKASASKRPSSATATGTGTGTTKASNPPSQKSAATGTVSTGGSGTPSTAGAAPAALETASPPGGAYSILAPSNWSYSESSSADQITGVWSGSSPTEKLQVTLSSCATCATSAGNASARAVGLPPGTVSSFDINRLALGYQAYASGNSTPDNGVIVVTRQGAVTTGYAQVDLWLASDLHSKATQILNSFSLLRAAER